MSQEKLGYEITTITEVTVSKGKLVEVQERIAKMNSVCAVYDVTGIEDSIVISKFKSRDEVSSFAKELLTHPPRREDEHAPGPEHVQGRLQVSAISE